MLSKSGVVVLAAVVSLATAVPARADGLTAEEQLKWDAAQALYGGGLTVKAIKGGVTITAGSKGLTQDKFNQYVEIYLDILKTVSVRQRGTSFKWGTDYSDAKFAPRAATKLGALLLEPTFKFKMCTGIAGRIGSKPTAKAGWDRSAWCVQQGVIDATTNTCVYRGTTTECAAAEDRGALALDEEIFVKGSDGNYPIVVAVSGGRDLITKDNITISEFMQQELVSAATTSSKIKADWQARLKKYFVIERAADAKQRKLVKARVAFADQPFYKWEVRTPAKQVSCKTAHVILYAPTPSRPHDYYYLVKVDGQGCDEHPLGAGETLRDNVYLSEQCRKLLDTGDKHTVEVSLHEMEIGATSTKKEWKRDRLKDVTYEWGKAGKKLFAGSVACTR